MDDLDRTFTFKLFARPSIVEGASRILDFGSGLQMYNSSKNPEEADSKAINGDWQAVGKDIELSIKQYGEKK